MWFPLCTYLNITVWSMKTVIEYSRLKKEKERCWHRKALEINTTHAGQQHKIKGQKVRKAYIFSLLVNRPEKSYMFSEQVWSVQISETDFLKSRVNIRLVLENDSVKDEWGGRVLALSYKVLVNKYLLSFVWSPKNLL